MKPSDKANFAQLITDVMAFYRQDVSSFALSVWWEACQSFDFEQVSKALTAHAMDPERGQFAPKPADLVRKLQGTHTDRALIAWGKTLDAIQRVGVYSSVVFDDGVIHAVIEDLGGWPKVCRTQHDELQFVQKRFCDSYRAYAGRPEGVAYPAKLMGAADAENARLGHKVQPPALIGDARAAKQVLACGMTGPKTQITHLGAVADVLRIAGGRAA